MGYYIPMDEITPDTPEQKLIVNIFGLIAKLGYTGEEKYDKVSIVQSGIFRLVVGEIRTDQLGLAVTYNISFGPHNKRGLIFGEYLEDVLIHIVGVNRTGGQRSGYREFSIKILLCNPDTTIKETKWYILKTNKDDKQTTQGLSWLDCQSLITTDQALALLEVLNKSF